MSFLKAQLHYLTPPSSTHGVTEQEDNSIILSLPPDCKTDLSSKLSDSFIHL